MRSTVACCCLIAALGCAHKTGPAPDTASSSPAIAEHEGAGLDAEACSHYLADAPPPLEEAAFMPVDEELVRAATAMIDLEAMPRCAHYELAHRVMVIALFDDPRVSQVMWEREDSVALLDAFAELANETCSEGNPDEWKLPVPAFEVGRTELLGRPVVVVDMIAPPIGTTEAHMFAVVGHPWPEGSEHRGWTGLDRYFVLEFSAFFQPTHTVMGGWARTNGRDTHLNMGAGPIATPSAFLHAVGRNLCGNYLEAMTEMPAD